MVAPLSLGMEEVASLRERLDAAVEKASADYRPKMMVLRDTYVAESEADIDIAIDALLRGEGYFSNLFRTDGEVKDGWVTYIDPTSIESQADNFKRDVIREAQMFDTAENILTRLEEYERYGTSTFLYNATWGLPFAEEVASVRRFGERVISAYGKA